MTKILNFEVTLNDAIAAINNMISEEWSESKIERVAKKLLSDESKIALDEALSEKLDELASELIDEMTS